MTVLSEQVRKLANESSFINQSSSSDLSGNFGSLVVPAGGAFFAYRYVVTATTYATGSHNVSINGIVVQKGAVSVVGDNVYSGLIWLDAGTYPDVVFSAEGVYVRVSSIKAGLCLFSDVSHRAFGLYSSAITSVAPAARCTPIGLIAKSTIIVHVSALSNVAGGHIELKNVGAGLDAYDDVFIQVDGVDVNWSEQVGGNPACGKLVLTVNAGSSHTIGFRVTNNGHHTPSATIRCSVINCPWLLTDSPGFPVSSLNFSRGSTLFVTVEPLFNNPATKAIHVGRRRCCSFGDATDFYGSSVGGDILAFEYRFDQIPPKSCVVEASGLGGCIAVVGVDRI